ncbi:MAG TPA: uroporphyrinogen-III synthase [Acetobacteraceae bacterium]
MTAADAQHAGQGGRSAVLVTRPEPGASETAARIRALGLTPVLAPMLHIAVLPVRLGPVVRAVLVTSGNALPPLPAGLHGLPLLAVGDATAARARAAGFTNVCSGDGDAVALAALAAEVLPPGTALLLATGAGQGGSLAADLRGRGFRVHRRAVYAARPARGLPVAARHALADGILGSAMFLSADTARAFVRALPDRLRPALAGVEALAIGQPAAEVLTYLPWRRVRVSAKPTLASVMALL